MLYYINSTEYLLREHKRIFGQHPSKKALQKHIKYLDNRVTELEDILASVLLDDHVCGNITPEVLVSIENILGDKQ